MHTKKLGTSEVEQVSFPFVENVNCENLPREKVSCTEREKVSCTARVKVSLYKEQRVGNHKICGPDLVRH